MALRTVHALRRPFAAPTLSKRPDILQCKFSVLSADPEFNEARQLVLEVKEKLERDHSTLPVGKNGRDDDAMIYWFLKDRKFVVQDAVAKLTKAIVSSVYK